MEKVALAISLSLIVLGACSNNTDESNEVSTPLKEEEHSSHTSSKSGDIREETTSVDVLPEFLNDKPEEMQNVYTAVAKNKELLENIPCYCGCGESVGHKNNYDCFIYENKENGKVVWDDHGTKCGVCLEIAAQSIAEYSEGKSVKEIRKTIDEKYKEGYAKPTPTSKA